MRPYGLRQSIRCPKKYGQSTKQRSFLLAPGREVDLRAEQDEAHSHRPLELRYVRNAAVLPDLPETAPPPQDSASNRATGSEPGPLMIHGFTVAEYQQAYSSVVEPLLVRPSGKPVGYSVELGRAIKDHLFEELAYPTLQVSEQAGGRLEVTERFCVLRPTPFIDLDCKGEPCK